MMENIISHVNLTHPGVRMACVFSSGVDTPAKLVYRVSQEELNNYFIASAPILISVTGRISWHPASQDHGQWRWHSDPCKPEGMSAVCPPRGRHCQEFQEHQTCWCSQEWKSFQFYQISCPILTSRYGAVLIIISRLVNTWRERESEWEIGRWAGTTK